MPSNYKKGNIYFHVYLNQNFTVKILHREHYKIYDSYIPTTNITGSSDVLGSSGVFR